ncbi:hypothetical protein B0A48_11945 [Cryoendolithus antarcticus]|uniref:Uncharacterized protein n=1 Tax=Cryoendolithus antarcticus TaxID=1507870 RepID=A0A1V8STT6_9PEZI|nr:hypothetical protein B0A48_11945 [Cryoendolithus antarcticus]
MKSYIPGITEEKLAECQALLARTAAGDRNYPAAAVLLSMNEELAKAANDAADTSPVVRRTGDFKEMIPSEEAIQELRAKAKEKPTIAAAQAAYVDEFRKICRDGIKESDSPMLSEPDLLLWWQIKIHYALSLCDYPEENIVESWWQGLQLDRARELLPQAKRVNVHEPEDAAKLARLDEFLQKKFIEQAEENHRRQRAADEGPGGRER